jgi:pimeloyl-ACP methyl ester carboxylesterase
MGRLTSTFEVDVTQAVPIPGHHEVRGVVVAPSGPTPPGSRALVWCCLPGGNCTSSYFDLHVDRDDTSSYSMAAHLADAGHTVLALDHLGTGASSTVEDRFLLTPEVLAIASHATFAALLQQLQEGSLVPGLEPMAAPVPIGLGHSMGAMITIIEQARYGDYAGVVNLGGGGAGLPQHLLNPDWVTWDLPRLRNSLVELARQQFSGTPARDRGRPGIFHAADVPAPVLDAFRSQLTTSLPSSALASILPAFSNLERGEISVPLFLGFGEHDLSQVPHESVPHFRSSRDITLFLLAGSGHCHNQAGSRRLLWDRMMEWARSIPLGPHRATD